MAYLQEPPFCWQDEAGDILGADIEVARAVLAAIGIAEVEFRRADFAEFIPGVAAGRWTMNVPMFVTPERAKLVAFSRPVWSLVDGLMIRSCNPYAPASYRDIARSGVMLGVVSAQVQHQTALHAGVAADRVATFPDPQGAIAALLDGRIDAYASAAMVLRGLAAQIPGSGLSVVEFAASAQAPAAAGAYSFARSSAALLDAFDGQLSRFLGSPPHLAIMHGHGFSDAEIIREV